MNLSAMSALLGVLGAAAVAGPVCDVLIVNGTVVDGTGGVGYRADVAVRDGRIAGIGDFADTEAGTVIDAAGCVVAPGFIDVHTHADSGLLRRRRAENFIRDGVTTIVTGNCGGSFWPTAEFLASAERGGVAVNVATLVGHNTVRSRVCGEGDVEASPEALRRMEEMVAQAMFEGAVGLSTGLIYTPGTYTGTGEIIALTRVAARHGGLYVSHMRSERENIVAAIDEALLIGREAGCPVQISHFKIGTPTQFHESALPLVNEILGTSYRPGDTVPAASRVTLEMVRRAQRAGQDVTMDQYPYAASSTGLATMIPDWVRADGERTARERLRDPETRARVHREMTEGYRRRGYEDLGWAQIAGFREDRSYDGKSIREVTVLRGAAGPTLEDDVDTVIDLYLAGGAGMVFHSQSEDNVIRIMQDPTVMICSDSGVREFGEGVPHPRGYGSNARVLGRYVRDLRVLPLEEAVRRMTSLPAWRFGLEGRGELRPGAKADIVVFNPNTVHDPATYPDPHHYAEGIPWVLVNGVPVVANSEVTGELPGDALRGPGWLGMH
ncbi:MAG: D-aminoacylase [Candidatus Sumerlaeia bacterium]|nr:D-aminoacylase [Candidatus Sumerlaeia bacterium]